MLWPMKRRAAISRLVRPCAASRATWDSCGVSWASESAARGRMRSPVASSSIRARLAEGLHSEFTEEAQSCAQLDARVKESALPPQPFAVEQLRARQFDPKRCLAKVDDRLLIQGLRIGAVGIERLDPSRHSERPLGGSRRGADLHPGGHVRQQLGVALPGRRFGEFASGECLKAQRVRLDHLPRVSQRVCVTPEPVVQNGGRVVGKENDPAMTGFDRGLDHRLDQRNGPIRIAAERIDQHGAVRSLPG